MHPRWSVLVVMLLAGCAGPVEDADVEPGPEGDGDVSRAGGRDAAPVQETPRIAHDIDGSFTLAVATTSPAGSTGYFIGENTRTSFVIGNATGLSLDVVVTWSAVAPVDLDVMLWSPDELADERWTGGPGSPDPPVHFTIDDPAAGAWTVNVIADTVVAATEFHVTAELRDTGA